MITSENQNSQGTLSFQIANKTIDLKKETIYVKMESIWSFSLTRDNQFLVVGGENEEKQFHIYQDKRPFKLLKKVNVNSEIVYHVQFCSKDQFLCVGCKQEHILIWNFNHLINNETPHLQLIKMPIFHKKQKFQFTPDENYLCLQHPNKIQFWNMEDEMIWKYITIDENFESFTIKQEALYGIDKSNLIQIIFLPKCRILKRILVNSKENEQIEICEDKFLIMNASSSKIFIINIQSGKIIRTFKTSVIKVALLNDTQYFSCYTKSADFWNEPDYIYIIEISTFKILLKYEINMFSNAHQFQFKPLKFFIANDNQIEVWKPIE